MPERDSLTERGRGLEEEYIRRTERELSEKLREAAAANKAREALSSTSGLTDPDLLRELADLGFTPETVVLLPLVPIIQVAWAEGGVSAAERDLIVSLARARGVEAGGPADQQLTGWMTTRPSDKVLESAGRLIRAMLESGSAAAGGISAGDLVAYCEQIASASGGVFGIGRVSGEERALLKRIADTLQARS